MRYYGDGPARCQGGDLGAVCFGRIFGLSIAILFSICHRIVGGETIARVQVMYMS